MTSRARIEAIVLDMDGTMLDTEPAYKAAWQQAADDVGFTLTDAQYLTVVGRSTADGEVALARAFGPRFPLGAFQARWPALWRERVDARGIPQKEGLPDLLAWIRARGLPVAVATSSDGDYAAFSLGRAGLTSTFPVVVTGDQIAIGKPAPDIYLEAARRLSISPNRCAALEDSEAGILAASRAGMLALLIPDLNAPSAAAAAAAARVLPSLHAARAFLADLLGDGAETAKDSG